MCIAKIMTGMMIVALIGFFPLYVYAPLEWGWENGPLENTQVAVTAIGAIVSLLLVHSSQQKQEKVLVVCAAIVWLLIVCRELSWGRVFFPVGIGPQGPTFIGLKKLSYGAFVKPVVAILSLSVLTGFAWCRHFIVAGLRGNKIAICNGLLMIVLAFIAWFTEKRLARDNPASQVLEEYAELIAYWCLLTVQVAVVGKLRMIREKVSSVCYK